MQLPTLTDLQFLVLGTLAGAELSGEELRDRLHESRSIRLAAFYRLMLRLEEAGLVEGRYEAKTIDGHSIREKFYRITGQGISAFREKSEFTAAINAQVRGAFNV